jgi:hypothetical protein
MAKRPNPYPAEFGEKEYEEPLYDELTVGSGQCWTPYQVLEKHIGFDAALNVSASYWHAMGRSPRLGVVMHNWGLVPLVMNAPSGNRGGLPKFNTNLFLQSKRAYRFSNLPEIAKEHSLGAPCRCFNVYKQQQLVLDTLIPQLGTFAEVSYACASFDSRAELFAHARRGRVWQQSTFPPAAELTGHSRWVFDKPGAVGVPNADGELSEFPTLTERIEQLVGRGEYSEEVSSAEELGANASRIATALREAALRGEGPLPQEVAAIGEAIGRGFTRPSALSAVAEVLALCRLLGLAWIPVGPPLVAEPSEGA